MKSKTLEINMMNRPWLLIALRLPILFTLLMVSAFSSQAQTVTIDWETLATVEYRTSKKEKGGHTFQKPSFSDTLLALEGERVQLAGYMLPLTVDQELYILSKFSFTECFFCNPSSGKESVIELRLRGEGKHYRLDAPMRWEGVLTLSKDPYELSFILTDAVPVKE